jgi:hypothetical protein
VARGREANVGKRVAFVKSGKGGMIGRGRRSKLILNADPKRKGLRRSGNIRSREGKFSMR